MDGSAHMSVIADDMPEDMAERSETLQPIKFCERAYRDALGAFATGVTLITANGSEGPVGMTVNSFASVSLDPALVLWSLAKSSGRFAPFADAQHFSIHVLDKSQAELALRFAKLGDAFDMCQWQPCSKGVPQIKNALARFDCTLNAQHDAGDHLIIVGAVTAFTSNGGDPLVFAKGSFGGFHAND